MQAINPSYLAFHGEHGHRIGHEVTGCPVETNSIEKNNEVSWRCSFPAAIKLKPMLMRIDSDVLRPVRTHQPGVN